MASALPASQSAATNLQVEPICIGDGLDAQSIGLLSTVVLPSIIGLLLWVSFNFCVAYPPHYNTRPLRLFSP